MKKYQAPKLTKYGKVQDFIQVGSIATGDVTGDMVDDTAVDNTGDSRADFIAGGDSGNQTPVTFITNESLGGQSFDFYDSDGDGRADVAIGDLNGTPTLQNITQVLTYYVTLSDSGLFGNADGVTFSVTADLEGSNYAGWNDPARD